MSRPDRVSAAAGGSPVAPGSTLQRLLVGYDGSQASGAASSFGLWLAGKAHARLTLLHVLDNDAQAERIVSPELLDALVEQRRDQEQRVREELDNLRAYAAAEALIETVVVRGRAAEALLEEARARDVDLILVGSSGVGAVRGAFLGSVSSQVIEHAACSVITFREGQPASPAHTNAVIVGIDGSAASREVLRPAVELARSLDARLVLVHVYDPTFALGRHQSALRGELRREGAEILRAARERSPGDIGVVEELAEGRAGEQLLAAAERSGPAVIIVGSRGRGGFKSLLLGSTSRWVANHAPCPVMIVRGL
jgi:nucleotide-binding universal stress UspA family protein